VVRSADVAIAQIETPYTDRGEVSILDVAARAADPDELAAFADAGFNVATLAGNHVFDQDIPAFVTPSTPYTDVASSQPARE
jgi:hypothetical protein